MRSNQRRILIALGWYDYRLHRGIERYALEHDWHLYANVVREKVIPWGWKGDGILAWLGAGDDLAEFVSQAHLPTVDFSFRRPQLNFPRVLEDHAQAAKLVADHFLARGFHNFIFYSEADNWSYEERGRGFVNALRALDHECAWHRWHESSLYREDREQWRQKRSWLVSILKKATKPLGVFAANDDHALDVLEACQQAGLSVPEEVAIVGAENNLLAPDAMHTPISSVDTNAELMGYQGAALLDDLMHGKPAPAEPIRIPPAELIIRKSSDLVAITHPGIARSLRFLWDHSHEAIGVEDLAREAAMSRRALHKAFLQHVGRTPGHELQRVRIERAKKLLRETDQKIVVIAGLCGYQSENSFWSAFKRTTRMSPNEYRMKATRGGA